MTTIAEFSCLDFEVVVPVWTARVEQLPQTRCSIRDEEKWTPAFVLIDVHTLMRPDASEFIGCDGQDDMAEDDAAEWERSRKLAATGLALPIGYFQRTGRQPRSSTEQQDRCGQREPDCGAWESPEQFCELEPAHSCGA